MSKFIPRTKVYDECERQQIAKAKTLANLKSAKAKIEKLNATGEPYVLNDVLTSDELREVERSMKFNMEIEA